MKISSTSEPLRPDRLTPASSDGRAGVSKTGEPVAQTEKVQLSDLASRLSQLETQFADASFDAKKVDEVRSAIAEGRFKVNADAIADRLLSSVAELLNKKG
jgi:negative regulator of flagellin synthesis FlgM